MAPLINLYAWNEVRIWCELYWDETEDLFIQELPVELYQLDLEPPKKPKPRTLDEFLKEPKEGEFKVAMEPFPRPLGPDWYVYDICELGLEDIIDPSGLSWPDQTLDSWAVWALQNGIAPFQPFLLSLPKPRYSGPDWEGEYDAEYFHDVVAVEPLSQAEVLKRWTEYFKSVQLEIP